MSASPGDAPTPPQHGAPAAPRSRRTRERLLDAAERLLAERGFEGTSMRAVTQAAGTSVSAANYHFGSKEALLRAVLLRRVEPLNAKRLENLERLQARARQEGRAATLEEVLEAFLRPTLERWAESAEARRQVRQVAARLYADPPELVAALKRELFAPIADRFLDALEAALPDRPRAEIVLRFQFTVGAMVHVMAGHLDESPWVDAPLAHAQTAAPSDEAVLEHMIAFSAAGLRARAGRDRAPQGGAPECPA